MSTSLIRRSIWGLGGLLLVILIGSFAMSAIAGRQLVQSTLVAALSDLTGRQVTVGGKVGISVFPSLRAELNGVAIRDWSQDRDAPPVLAVETIILDLSARAALRGIADISAITLTGPVLTIARQDGSAVFVPGGRIESGFRRARRQLDLNPEETDFKGSRGLGIGRLVVNGGRVRIAGSDSDLLSSVSGTFAWGRTGDAATLDAKGVWRGEPVAVTALAGDLVHLAAGRLTDMQISVQSEPLTASFDGMVTLKPMLFGDGEGDIRIASGTRFSAWTGITSALADYSGPIGLRGTLRGDSRKLALSDGAITFSQTTGRGSLTLTRTDGNRVLTGTMDLDRLDIAEFAQLVLGRAIPIGPADGTDPASNTTAQTEAPDYGLDLRLSAKTARFGAVTLNGVAATAQRNADYAAIDINNADVFGGTVQMAARLDDADKRSEGRTEFRLLAENIDFAAFDAAMPDLPLGLPNARGTISLIVRSDGLAAADVLARSDGSLTIRAGAGTLPGIALADFVGNLRQGTFFPLFRNDAGLSLAFNGLEAKGAIRDGDIAFERIALTLDNASLTTRGKVSVSNQGLAMSGTLRLGPGNRLRSDQPVVTTDEGDERIDFFVGGDFDRSFVTPMLSPARAN